MIKIFQLAGKLTSGMALIISAIFAFLATVTYLAAAEAIATIAPVVVWAVASCGLIVVVVAAMAFSIDRCQQIALKTIEFWRDCNIAKNDVERDYNKLLFEDRMMSATADQVENGLIHPAALGGEKFSSFPAQVINRIEQAAVPLLEPDHRSDLLPALVDCPNILVIGGKGRGKTQLLLWIEHDRLKRGNVVTVLDSHAKPAQWGGQVVGAGRKYESIAAAMIDLNGMLDSRYDEFSQGKEDFTIIDTFIDEFTLLPDKLKKIGFDIQEYSKSALTEGRKVGMNCIWGIHSDRAEALGLKGAKDLLECFDAIVYLKKVQSDYYAKVDFGEGAGETKYNHPGKFTIDRPASKVKILSLPAPGETPTDDKIAVSNWPKPVSEPDHRPSPDEMAIIEAVKKVELVHGKIIWSKVTKQLGQVTSGANNDRIKKCLDKWNITY